MKRAVLFLALLPATVSVFTIDRTDCRQMTQLGTPYQVRSYIDSEIAALESSLFPGSESIPLLTLMRDLRHADELMHSQKADEKEKGERLLKETLRLLR